MGPNTNPSHGPLWTPSPQGFSVGIQGEKAATQPPHPRPGAALSFPLRWERQRHCTAKVTGGRASGGSAITAAGRVSEPWPHLTSGQVEGDLTQGVDERGESPDVLSCHAPLCGRQGSRGRRGGGGDRQGAGRWLHPPRGEQGTGL